MVAGFCERGAATLSITIHQIEKHPRFRDTEIVDILARKICKDLDIPML
jgi:aerobic-type carbon monoxide dehydrogenase small subunit (CoxS/CutS family)